ncbi:MAG: right-handed parallel beta-helix repeat-containing protein [Planctomycetes bacterium]|nr:right-handed parallel beta-helix repeat-containing protein [Planctomycetota bacterium]
MKKMIKSGFIAGWLLLCTASVNGDILFAKVGGATSGNCDSWANACELQTAINTANEQTNDEVLAQAGTYNGTISLKNGIKVIGGFAGTETSASQSDPVANATVIDGDGARAVTASNANSSTVLRGFRITNGSDGGDDGGGGLCLQSSSVRIVDCVFDNNTASRWGGAVAVRGTSSPEFVNCTFHNNTGAHAGGAVYIYSGSPVFTNCLFYDNQGGDGGVLANQAGTAKFYHCTMADNHATIGSGGAIHDEQGDVAVYNSILWDNTAVRGNAHIYHGRDGVTKVRYSDLQGGRPGTGNTNADPKFTNSAANDYTLLSTSPCRNAGLDSYLPGDVGDLDWDGNTSETIPQDLDGCKRKRETSVDMGAYEYQDSGCCEDGDCTGSQVCIDYECEECVDDGDCGSGQICCSNACESWECCDDSDCTGPLQPLCRTSDHTCVLCLTDQDCAFGCCKPNGTCGSCGGGGGGGTNQSSAPPP